MKERDVWNVEKGQATYEDYRNIIMVFINETRKAKAQLELNLASNIKDNRKFFYKYISRKTKNRENGRPLLNQMGVTRHTKGRNTEFFHALVFTAENVPQESQTSEVREKGQRKKNFPLVIEDWVRDKLD